MCGRESNQQQQQQQHEHAARVRPGSTGEGINGGGGEKVCRSHSVPLSYAGKGGGASVGAAATPAGRPVQRLLSPDQWLLSTSASRKRVPWRGQM